MNRLITTLITTALLLALAACGGAPATTQPQAAQTTAAPQPTARPTAAPEPTAAPTAPTTPKPTAAPTAPPQPTGAPTAAAQPAGATVIVIFHKSGGIMGLDETLTVRADGALERQGRGGKLATGQAPADQIDKLRALLASPEFAKLQPRYQAQGADLFVYDISVPGGAPARVQTMDGVENPPVLDQVIQVLNQLLTGV